MNKLILLRHGQSIWNYENRFTGCKDVPLTAKGVNEAIKAGDIMAKNKIFIDIVFTSVLQRAYETANHAVKRMNLQHLWNNNNLIMTKHESLNERDYGDLVGLNKQETADKFGEEQVHLWRRSFETSPPNGESLKDVLIRVEPFFRKNIASELTKNKNVLIAAHGNSLRAILIHLGLYNPEEISKIELPTGAPFVINYENSTIIDFQYIN